MKVQSSTLASFLLISLVATGCGDGAAGNDAADVAKTEPSSAKSEDEATGDAKPAQEPTAAPDAKVYGPGLEGADTVSIAAVMDDPKAYEGKTVRVEGLVVDVCTKRGCWFEMAGEKPGVKMRFKVKDGTMVFPASAKGKHAVAEGTISLRDLSLEETREWEKHMAEDAGKEFDPASITEPLIIVQLEGRAAEIRDST